ncbi:Zn-ribbon domain-containing OB-fold protein [Natrinema halophilum]|uniref:OB-fold domain-containing protein n=1 Tax=Natrinema halophilum TaxID=1699371 RepID=A0A7D5H0J9_9EURY|nr:OB-fold domain-containing protein [Natrinema halophilum]QLG47571.1 OB-fold domain-containing protein [Natrinema halophilum]
MTDVSDTAERFWDGLADDVVRLPKCTDCGTVAFPPGLICTDCGCDDFTWTDIDPVGTIHSFTRQHRTAPAFESPIVMGIVDLDAGPRLLAPFAAEYGELSIGDRVRIEPIEYDADYDRGRRADAPFFQAVLAGSSH